MGLGTRGKRPCDCLIIHEVDNILLDEGAKLAMLSTRFTGIDKLQPMYHLIQSAMLEFDSEHYYYCVDENLYRLNGEGKPMSALDLEKECEPTRVYLKRNLEDYICALLGIDTSEAMKTWKIKEPLKLP